MRKEIMASSTSTNYAFVIGPRHRLQEAGRQPPPHRHLGEDEVFTVIEGEFEFFQGQSWTAFRRGEVRYSLRGNYHGFRNVGSTGGTMMFTTNGGGLDDYFAAISSLELPKDMARLQEISRFYRYEYLAPKS